jgi:hypothetical protein
VILGIKVMKRRSVISIFFYIVLLTLGGCAVGTQNVKPGYMLESSTGKGLVLGTITLTRKTHTLPRFQYQKVNGEYGGFLRFENNPFTHSPVSDLADRLGKLVMIELPAGKYQITDIEFRAGVAVGSAYVDLSTSHHRTVEFEVVPGKMVYLGDLLVDDQGGFYSGVGINALSVRAR